MPIKSRLFSEASDVDFLRVLCGFARESHSQQLFNYYPNELFFFRETLREAW